MIEGVVRSPSCFWFTCCHFRAQILGQLKFAGFIRPRGAGDIRDLNSNSNNWAVVKVCFYWIKVQLRWRNNLRISFVAVVVSVWLTVIVFIIFTVAFYCNVCRHGQGHDYPPWLSFFSFLVAVFFLKELFEHTSHCSYLRAVIQRTLPFWVLKWTDTILSLVSSVMPLSFLHTII